MEIDFTAAGSIASAAAAVVAAVAAGIAIWQARVAAAARDATLDQAKSARAAVDEARASRSHTERPRIHVEVSAPPNAKVPWTTVIMAEGAEVRSKISWERELSVIDFDDSGQPFEDRRRDSGTYETELAVNGSSMLPWWRGGIPDDIIWLTAKIVVESTEVGGEGRSWRHVESVSWRPH